ncbi:MAG: hypothetical protein WCL29_07590 [Pseudomonadota bacterium]
MLINPTIHILITGLLTVPFLAITIFVLVSKRAQAFLDSPSRLPPPKTFKALILVLIARLLPPKNIVAWIILGLGLIVVVTWYEMPSIVYIVQDGSHSRRLLYGKTLDFTFANSSKYHSEIQADFRRGCTLINNTRNRVFLTSIAYTNEAWKVLIAPKGRTKSIFSNDQDSDEKSDTINIEPYTLFIHTSRDVDFFGPTSPPKSITTQGKRGIPSKTTNYWLHYE